MLTICCLFVFVPSLILLRRDLSARYVLAARLPCCLKHLGALRVSPRGFLSVSCVIALVAFRHAALTPYTTSTQSSHLTGRVPPCFQCHRALRVYARLPRRFQHHEIHRFSRREFRAVSNVIAIIAFCRASSSPCPTSSR